MNKKRIIGRTVGTTFNPEKLKEDLGGSSLSDTAPLMNGTASPGVADAASRADHVHPVDSSRMPAISEMGRKGAFDNNDKIPAMDSASGEMKYSYWSNIVARLWDSIQQNVEASSVERAYSVINESGGTAFLPEEFNGFGTIALQSDITKALVDYLTRENTETYVQGYAQPKGSYLIPQDLADHNTDKTAHNDIRLLIDGLTSRLNALADSDDNTLDQLSEVVEYIKANRGLIESVTTSKVNVTDIIDNLTTNVANKPLSAGQGVELKRLIDAIIIPSKISAFDNDKGYLTSYTESDPTVPAWAKAATKPSYTKSEVGLGNVDNVKQYSESNPPPYPVQSVNGKTGTVQLTATDVGAVSKSTTLSLTGVDEDGNEYGWLIYGGRVK